MLPTTFELLQDQAAGLADIIVIVGVNTRVKVFNLTEQVFLADPAELRFYGKTNNNQLVFETQGWSPANLTMVTAALQWYANEVGHPNMKISIRRRGKHSRS
jgi:hypothetical protein